jgi:hypothetical protein
MPVNLSTKVHEKGSRGSAQSVGLFYDCEPCEPCEPYKLNLQERVYLPPPHGLHERVAEPSDPPARVWRR